MLTELSIRNFAIIDQISITFQEGLTVLTGETGAGKSIIIDALQLLGGGRGSVDFVRHKATKAEIEGLFNIDERQHPVKKVGDEYGIDIQDGMVVLERTITQKGKSICRVNGKLVTLAILKEFGKKLIDIHSQHETQSLMDGDNHIHLLDLYDQKQIQPAKEAYTQLFSHLKKLKQRYKDLNDNEQEMAHRLDLLEFQRHELEEAQLEPNEDELLERERQQLANHEQIYNGLNDAYNALSGEMKAIDYLNQAQMTLQETKELDPFIKNKADYLTDYYYMIEDIAMELSQYTDTLEFDSERLNEIESRLNEINRLMRKYGNSVNKMLDYLAKIDDEINTLTDKDTHLVALEKEIDELEKDAYLEAKQLHDVRKKTARKLKTALQKELKGLYLDKASFDVKFDAPSANNTTLHKNGIDTVHFFISTNIGEPLKEMSKIASGGELSRIMLALKTLFAKHQGVTSVIFDEVDTGVSGRVAQSIAEKIYTISTESQVLCITHLPQVAAMADTHLLIEKEEHKNRTETKVSNLTVQEQTEEISRMITGREITETAVDHAIELIELANEYKEAK
ncbi:MAG TPA: DNA repair protein RecN [Bacillota bacterium]|nr:DNA repair protein RecN [Bacillota bacterium]